MISNESKSVILLLTAIYLFSSVQFMILDHDSCEWGHSQRKQCPLHKNCCGVFHLSILNAAATAGCEKFSPPDSVSGINRVGSFLFVEKLFDKTVFHPPRPAIG